MRRKTTIAWHSLAMLLIATTSLPVNAASIPLETCADYHCDYPVKVSLSPAAIDEIADTLLTASNPTEERERIAIAIGRFEQLVGHENGSWRDKGKNPGNAADDLGQLDCIAESRNSSTYLGLLARMGLLRWHDVEPRVVRYRYLFAAHWTAVIRDRTSGVEYAVDSWHDDNGEPARIIPLEAWYQGKEAG